MLPMALPLPPRHCPRSCCGCPGLGRVFWCPGPWGGMGPLPWGPSKSSLHVRNEVQGKGWNVGKSHAGVQALGARGWGGAAGLRVGVCPGRPRAACLLISSAAQRREAVHEGLPQPRPRRQLQLGGHWQRAASCGQPGPPPVQPHRLEEEKTHTHTGQPACQSQQVMLPAVPPGLPRRLQPGGCGAPGPETSPGRPCCMSPCGGHVLKNKLPVSSVKPY